jgi:hypothetical protein
MPMTNSLSPSVVKTELDDVFYQEFERGMHPGYVDATSSLVFVQDISDSSAEILETFKGVSAWGEKDESGNIPEESARVDNQKTYSMITFAKGVELSKEFFDDNKHQVYERTVQDFARKAKLGRDKNAFKLFNGGFDTYVTADDSYIFANDHTTLSGSTVDNLGTAALSESSLNDAIIALVEQKDQAGEVMGNMPETLLVPPKLFKTACGIVESEFKADTADNNINVYSSKYNIYIATSERLGAAAGGSDTAWFLLARNKGTMRWTREGLSTYLNDWRATKNQSYFYGGRFREEVGAQDYVGLWGSQGNA